MTRLTGAVCSIFLLFGLVACGDDSDEATSTTTAPVEETTTSGTEVEPAPDIEAIDGFAAREVTYANLTYSVSTATVTKQSLRSYAEGAEPEPTETSHLVLDVSVENPTARQLESDPDAIRLELGGDELPVVDAFLSDVTGFIGANRTVDGFLAFEVDADASIDDATLVLGAAPDRPVRLPLAGPVPESELPLVVEVTGSAVGTGPTNGGTLSFELLEATLFADLPHGDTTSPTGERADEGEIFVQLHVQVTKTDGRGNDLLTDDAFKLLVDDVARAPFDSAIAPEGSTPTPTAEPGATVDAWVLFAVDAGAGSYVLQVGAADDSPGTITIDLPAV